MTFTPIDAASWPQMQTFYYFSQIAPHRLVPDG